MVQSEDLQSRTRVAAKAWVAGVETVRRRAGFALPDGIAAAIGRLRKRAGEWVQAEVAPGRLLPWLSVTFGVGLVIYFSVDREPVWWMTVPLALAGSSFAVLVRNRRFGFPLALAFAAMTMGFAVATVHTVLIGHPVLRHPVASASISGFVETQKNVRKATVLLFTYSTWKREMSQRCLGAFA
jgi:competence protein ComEC